MTEVDEAVHGLERERKIRGIWLLLAALVFGLLTVGVYVAVKVADNAQDDVAAVVDATEVRDVRIEDLAKALGAQRRQFQACRDKGANAPGCRIPVAPPPSEVGPQGIPGLQGTEGQQGNQGIPGLQGRDGNTGATGSTGEQGFQGQPGKNGSNGPSGPPGPVGSDGKDGAPGTKGGDGTNGQDGQQGPKGEPGEKGNQGDPGRDGTDGLPGPAGATAPTITSIAIQGQPNDCFLVFTFSDATTYQVMAPAQFCAVA